MRRSRLERAAVRLVAACGPEDVVLVGGLAVALHGYVRATDDVDILTRSPLPEVQKRLAGQGIKTRLLRGDVLEGDFPFLQGEIDGIRFDVLPQLAPVAWERLPEVRVGATKLKVVDLPGLLALKLRAQGPQDLLDAAALVLLHPEVEETALRLATMYKAADRFTSMLRDPRLQGSVSRTRRRR